MAAYYNHCILGYLLGDQTPNKQRAISLNRPKLSVNSVRAGERLANANYVNTNFPFIRFDAILKEEIIFEMIALSGAS